MKRKIIDNCDKRLHPARIDLPVYGRILLAALLLWVSLPQAARCGEKALYIDEKGNVGIGTTEPEALLHVEGRAVINGDATIRGNALMSGKVGIGTDPPKANLDVQQANRSGVHPAVKGLYVTGDFAPDNGVEFRHSDGSQGIGFGYNTIYATGETADQDLNLKPRGTGKVSVQGPLNVQGHLNFHGRYQRDDAAEMTYEISPRYHLSLTAKNYQGRTKTIPADTLVALCGDQDGCQVRLGMTRWTGSQTETASVMFLFYYSNSDGHWRSSINGGETLGIDGNRTTQHVRSAWETCYFTDGNFDKYKDQGDPGQGMQLLVWNRYKGPDRTCELTLID